MEKPQVPAGAFAREIQAPIKVVYCLYARKSTESEEQQILSIDSQIKEMESLAAKEHLEIAEIKKESHSAKEAGQRPVFNELVEGIREGKFNGILTWAPDRISRNAGDLGRIVDFMDSGKLVEIRTHGRFWIDGTYAWCQYQEPGDEHLWRYQATPSEVADFVRNRIAKSVSA